MITRKIDDLGRIVIPTELRQELGVKEGDFLEISIDNGEIIIRKQIDGTVEVEDTTTKEEYKETVREMIEDVQDYLGKISELLEELGHLD